MAARNAPLLVNVPPLSQTEAPSKAELESMRRAAEEAAGSLRAKIDQDRQRREALIAGITDAAMRDSLKKR